MIKTRINDILGIKYPVFQGGMAWVADGRLAAAVSEAGGLGIIGAGNAPADYVEEQIRIAASLTDKPFGVNIMLESPFSEDIAEVVAREKVAVVTTGAGNPARFMKAWTEAGIKVIPVVPSVAMAKLMIRQGATALIAEGGESGGHIGELTTMVLVPQIVDVAAPKGIPVIAAGGIADGRGFAAAVMLGAEGVQIGTRFLLAEECNIHEEYKKRIEKATDLSTMVTGRRPGSPVRSIRTKFSREYLAKEYSGAPEEELEKFGQGALRAAVQDGDAEKGCFLAGQIAAMVNKRQPAAEIVEEICVQAEEELRRCTAWLV